jgi:hypothetical protein
MQQFAAFVIRKKFPLYEEETKLIEFHADGQNVSDRFKILLCLQVALKQVKGQYPNTNVNPVSFLCFTNFSLLKVTSQW